MKKDAQAQSRTAPPPAAAATLPRQDEGGFTVNIRLSVVLYVAVVWSYFAQATARPFDLPPVLNMLIYTVLAVGSYWFYRNHSVSFRMRMKDLAVLGIYFASFVALNLTALTEPIASDEQAHAEDSFVFLRLARALMDGGSLNPAGRLSVMPLNEMVYYFSAGVLMLTALVVFLARAIDERRRPAIFHAFLAIVTLAAGLALSVLPSQLSPHAPMRILPVFASYSIFGLNTPAFRIPGIAAMAVVSFALYRVVLRKRPGAEWFAFAAGFGIAMIPTVLHVSTLVVASFWAYVAWVICFLFIYLSLETGSLGYMVAAGTTVAVGSLMRQNVAILWPILGLLFIVNPAIRKPLFRNGLTVCLQGIIALPYFLAVKQIGHPLMEERWRTNLFDALTNGSAVDFVLKQSSVFWVAAGAIGAIYVILACKSRLRLLYLMIIPTSCLYFSLQRWVLGVGRYQAEYIAPLTALTVFLAAVTLPSRLRPALVALLVFLGAYSVNANRNICQDVNFGGWDLGPTNLPKGSWPYGSCMSRRLSSEKYLPYEQAVGWVQKQEAGGNFVIAGGVGVHADGLMAPLGFSLSEISVFTNNAKIFDDFIRGPDGNDIGKFFEFLAKNRINYFLLQYGDKTEFEHRWMNYDDNKNRRYNMNDLFYRMGFYYRDHFGNNAPYVYQHTFFGKMGGAIDVYSAAPLRYGPYPVKWDTGRGQNPDQGTQNK